MMVSQTWFKLKTHQTKVTHFTAQQSTYASFTPPNVDRIIWQKGIFIRGRLYCIFITLCAICLTLLPVRIIFVEASALHDVSVSAWEFVSPTSPLKAPPIVLPPGDVAACLFSVCLKMVSTTFWTRRSLPNSPGLK